MQESNVLIGALIFLLLVVGANFIMYAAVRGLARSGEKGFFEIFIRSLNASPKSQDASMDELHRRVNALHQGKNKARRDSE